MNRNYLSEEELLKWMNYELSKHEEGTDCRFVSISDEGKDESGCNWGEAKLKCSGVLAPVCQAVAAKIVAQAKKKFNVKK